MNQQLTLEDMSVVDLKAAAYDVSKQIQQWQQGLIQIEKEIQKRIEDEQKTQAVKQSIPQDIGPG
jgi:hypothetical protein